MSVQQKPVLEVSNLSARYGKVGALVGATLTVPAGSIVTVIGANGAGKSTMLNAVMGSLPHRPCRRRGALLGHRRVGLAGRAPRGRGHVSGAGTPRAVRHHVGRGQSVAGWFPPLSRARAAGATLNEVFDLFPACASAAPAGRHLSGGERQMLAVGRALMAKPQLLMLDEPSLGLAPRIVREIFHIIARLRETGVAILLVEQNARARCRWPTTAMCWRPAKSRCTVRPASWPATPRSSRAISAWARAATSPRADRL